MNNPIMINIFKLPLFSKLKPILFLSSLFFLIGLSNLFAQDINDFNAAVDLFSRDQFDQALGKFKKLTAIQDEYTTASIIFYAKTLNELKRPAEAEVTLEQFQQKFPFSKFSNEAELTLTKSFLMQGKYPEAFNEIFLAYQKSDTGFYREYSRKIAEDICIAYLFPDDLTKYITGSQFEKERPFLKLLLAKLYFKEGQKEQAQTALVEIMRKYPVSHEFEEAIKLYSNPPVTKKTPVSTNTLVGVILPLTSSENAAAAKEILEGIKYAVSELNNGRDDKIGLLIRDSGTKGVKIHAIESEFISEPGVKAVLGPIFSDEVKKVLEDFKDENLVILSPTATEEDLTKIYGNFFQANPNFTARGKLMAQYIYFVENKRRMAVLNALEGYSPVLASSFINEFQRLGGIIEVKETYKSGGFDLEQPVSKIAEKMPQLDGIYIPLADKIDAQPILGQLISSSVDLPIFGDQDWFYVRGLEKFPELSDKLTFTSDYFIDYSDPVLQQFAELFFNKTKMDINRNILYGYDGAKYLLTVLRNVSGNREAVKYKMESGLITNGLHNNICFDQDRVNRFLNIIHYSDGKFNLAEHFKMN